MTVETEVAEAFGHPEPLDKLAALVRAAHSVDRLRSEVARLKGLTAVAAAESGYTQREIASYTGVTPMMVQQWVKRGRDEHEAAESLR